MAGSTFGTEVRVTTWGESHGKAIGCVVDGCPAGLPLCEEDIQIYLDRRKPGQNRYTTARAESDTVEILSGVFEGKTTGTPISLIVWNKDQRSRDYSEIASFYRPAHADQTFDQKYGFRDYRGGGRSSGRETIGRVAAGAIAAKVLAELGISVTAYTLSIGPVCCDPAEMDTSRISASPLYMPDAQAETLALSYLDDCIRENTSSGGTIECRINGMKAGIGETVFDKLDAELGHALFSIGAVKAVEIGDGCAVRFAKGHENNDTYAVDNYGQPVRTSNHGGGIYGGMSDGSEILLRAHIKPTPSIGQVQSVLYRDGHVGDALIKGRHDPIIVPRAVVVVETMTAITLLDMLLRNMGSRMDTLKTYYE